MAKQSRLIVKERVEAMYEIPLRGRIVGSSLLYEVIERLFMKHVHN